MPLVGEVAGHRQDPGVVVPEPEARRQRVGVRVVELDPNGAAQVADRDGRVETAVLHPQLVEHPQRRPGEEAQLRVVPLALELGDHHDRQDDFVLGEPLQGAGVGQQDAGVEDIGAVLRSVGGHCGLPLTERRAHSRPPELTTWIGGTEGRSAGLSTRTTSPGTAVSRCAALSRNLSRTGLRYSGLPHPPIRQKVRPRSRDSQRHARTRGEEHVTRQV